MGCDIHIFIERRASIGAPWEAVLVRDFRAVLETPEGKALEAAARIRARSKGGEDYLDDSLPHWYDGDDMADEEADAARDGAYDRVRFREIRCWRNYRLFGRLAGVRASMTPLAPPRGLPKDASDFIRNDVGEDGDLHTPTFFMLNELNGHDWTKEENGGSLDFEALVRMADLLAAPELVRVIIAFDN